MGAHHNSNIGYGILVLEEDNDDEYEVNVSSNILKEDVGCQVLGEDNGYFFYTTELTISIEKVKYVTEYVTEYKE